MRNHAIQIRGGRENNLQGVDIDIPKHQITVFTGVSGSGKSSLAFDTIAAESQRCSTRRTRRSSRTSSPRRASPTPTRSPA